MRMLGFRGSPIAASTYNFLFAVRLRALLIIIFQGTLALIVTPTVLAQTNTGLKLCYTGNDSGKTSTLNFNIFITSSDTGTFFSNTLTLAPGACSSVSLSLAPQS